MNEQEQEKLRQLYHRSRQEEPSADMDRRIRNAARRALNGGSNWWIWGLSTAAVLLLSFNVVLELFMGEQHETGIYEQDLPSSLPRMDVDKRLESNVEKIEQKQVVPAAPAEKPVIEFYQVLPHRKLESELESLSEDAATPGEKKSEIILRKRSSSSVEKPASAEFDALRRLPHQLADLLRLADGLSGEELASGKVLLYSDNKLILMVEPGIAGFQFKAWRGAEIIGVKEDWSISPSSLDDCHDQGAYTSCLLRPGIVGFFEADRMDHVNWIQADE